MSSEATRTRELIAHIEANIDQGDCVRRAESRQMLVGLKDRLEYLEASRRIRNACRVIAAKGGENKMGDLT